MPHHTSKDTVIATLLRACEDAKRYLDNCDYIRVKKTGVPYPELSEAIEYAKKHRSE